jgi:SAM-dependent methyltransferase
MKKTINPYQLLAALYDAGEWGQFSQRYLQLLDIVSKKCNFNPQLIIDVACGTGILAAELHKRKYQIIGVDVSSEMIEVACRNHPNIKFLVEDIRFMKLGVEADLVTCAFDSMNYLLGDKQLSEACRNIHRHLRHEGYFLFDINTPAHYIKHISEVINREVAGKKFKQRIDYSEDSRIARITFDFCSGEIEEHIQRAYTNEEVTCHLSKSGFKVLETFQDLDLTPANEISERIFFFAQKIEHGK